MAGIVKRAAFGEHFITGNDVKLLNAEFMQNCSMHQIEKKETVVCIQKYIKSSGPKAFVCRTIWKKDAHGTCFIITSRKKFNDETEQEKRRYIARVNEDFS